MQGVAAVESGLASGMVNTSRLVGGALGLAALTTLATTHANAEVASGTAPLVAQADGYSLAFLAGAGLCALGAIAASLMLREPGPQATPAPAESG